MRSAFGGTDHFVSPPRCKVCPLTFLTKSEMQIHSKSHTEAKPHKCPHCSKTFANASYLAQHLRIHLGIKPYHCSYCENSFRQLSHLQQHTRSDRQAASSGTAPLYDQVFSTVIAVFILQNIGVLKLN